jgi:hypothetical protein
MTDDIVFEEPPPRTGRREHYPLLMVLKANPVKAGEPGGYARVRIDLTEKEANGLANSLRAAAKKLGDGFEVISRYIPDSGKHGVWARYVETPGDQPPPEEIAAAMNTEAMAVDPPVQVPTVPTAADVLQHGVVNSPEYTGTRTVAYGEPPF